MEKAAKKTTTNAKKTMKGAGTGIDKERERQGKIWDSKQREAENSRKAREEEQENLRKAREEEEARKAREEEEAKLREERENLRKAKEKQVTFLREEQERWSRRSDFGNLMFLVFEFPKGGDFWLHKYSKFLHSVSLAPPCLIKGVYANRSEFEKIEDKDIGNRMKMIYLGIDKRVSFVPLDKYDKCLREFLEFSMANMGEPSVYAKGDVKWFIAFYWRRQWLKHGFCHGIAEMDYYWKIYHLYQKVSLGHYLYYRWNSEVGYYQRCGTDKIMVMSCKGSTLYKGIRKLTARRSLILSNPYTNGLRQIYIGFDGDENLVDVPETIYRGAFGPDGFWNLELYI